MSCERHRAALTDVALGGPCPPGLEEHLRGCEGCRTALREEMRRAEQVDADLRAALALEPSPWLLARVRAACRAETEGETREPSRRRELSLAAAAVLAVLVLIVLARRPPEPVPAAPAVARGVPETVALPEAPSTASDPENATRPGSTDTAPAPRASDSEPAPAPRALPSARPKVPPAKGPASAEVLVPPEEAVAVALYLSAWREGRVDLGPPYASAEPAPVPDLAVDPLDVEALAIAPLEGS